MAQQLSLADTLVDERLGSNPELEAINRLIDWVPLEGMAAQIRPGKTGRPPYQPLAMIKALLLQALYDLSDPGVEKALLDRMSFRVFCGFGLADRTPDETTICRFRQEAAEAGLLEKCFAEVNRQLEAKGLMLKKGTLMDATLVVATHKPPSMAAGRGAPHPKEPGASWTKKNGRPHFGYKGHVGVDMGSGLVRRAVFTGAKTYESEVADELISFDERAVYGDRAYPKRERRAALKEAGIKDRIATRRHKTEPPLNARQRLRNNLIARHRAPVEGIFSQLKRFHGFARTRCYSLTRNAADFFAALTTLNLKRAVRLSS